MKKFIMAAISLAFILGVSAPVSASEVNTEPLLANYQFSKEEMTVWTAEPVKASTHPSAVKGKPILVPANTEVKVEGESASGLYVFEHDGRVLFADGDDFVDEKPEEKPQEQTVKKAVWNGPVLSASAGTVAGPSGKETYYNLDMSGVVSIMRGMGNTDEYWVREGGVKMLGDYVMVAAHLNLRPRGSLVETSLGTGIVCDTGGFAYGNPTQLDIATAW